MKKALAILLALALVGSAAFAQTSEFLSFSSWGRVLWDVAGTHEDDVESTLHQSWGGDAPRTSVKARGETDVVTYALDLFANGADGISVGDNAYIEIRPFDAMNIPVKAALLIGKSDMNEARRDTTFGMWNWDRIGSVNPNRTDSMEGMIFDDLLDVGGGASLRLYPIEGLTVGVQVPLSYSDTDSTDSQDIADVWGNMNAYISYALPANIGAISVGYDSRRPGANDNWDYWGIINAAFEFTMVEGLYAAIGAKIPTSFDHRYYSYDYLTGSMTAESGDSVKLALYVNYDFDSLLSLPLKLHVLFNSSILTPDMNSERGNESEDPSGFGFQVGIGAEYEVIENVPIWVDVRYANGVYMMNSSYGGFGELDCWTFGVGVSKLWANAEIGVAFELATNGYGNPNGYHNGIWYTTNNNGEWVRDLVWTIPIKFQYSF